MAKLSFSLPFRSHFDRLGGAWVSLSDRERRLLALVGLALVLFVTALAFTSLRKGIADREAAVVRKQMSMQQIGALASGFSEAERARSRMEARIKGTPVRLFSYLEDIATRQQITLGDMQDRGSDSLGEGISRSTVEVGFARIDLPSLTGFLNEIEKSPQLEKVEKLRVRGRDDDPNVVDANVTVTTYSLSQG